METLEDDTKYRRILLYLDAAIFVLSFYILWEFGWSAISLETYVSMHLQMFGETLALVGHSL